MSEGWKDLVYQQSSSHEIQRVVDNMFLIKYFSLMFLEIKEYSVNFRKFKQKRL